MNKTGYNKLTVKIVVRIRMLLLILSSVTALVAVGTTCAISRDAFVLLLALFEHDQYSFDNEDLLQTI